MAVKIIISSTLQLLLLSFVVQVVMPMHRTPAIIETTEEDVLMIYSTGKNEVGVKNGSNLYRVPTPSDMKHAAYNPTYAELYLTFRWGPNSREPGGTGAVYRMKLSDNKAESGLGAFGNSLTQGPGADPGFGPDCLEYDGVEQKLYFCDRRGVGSCDRDSGNCTIVHDYFGKAVHGCRFASNPRKGTLYSEEPHPDKFPTIHKGSKDGTGEFVKIMDEAFSLTVDQDSGFLFYVAIRDPTNATKATPAGGPSAYAFYIMKTDLDGKNQELVRTLQGSPVAFLQVANDRVYWAEGKGRKYFVYSCNKFSGEDLREYQLDGLALDEPFSFISLLVTSQKSSLQQ